jgi:hypothetical protein
VDIDLALGRHFDLIAELQQLTSEHPLRERLRGLLMLALYRCGRLSEALAVFRETRRNLHDELGVEPGQLLQELHQQILSADSSLDAPRAADVTPVAAMAPQTRIPAQHPHSMADFTGRTGELRELDSLLTTEGADSVLIAMIVGTPGVGKTTLAVQWAHRIKERFPDGQLYVNLRGFDPGGPAQVLVRAWVRADLRRPASRCGGHLHVHKPNRGDLSRLHRSSDQRRSRSGSVQDRAFGAGRADRDQ